MLANLPYQLSNQTMRYHFTHTRMAIVKKIDNN